MQSEREQQTDTLIDMRTHLTVLTLALAQLRRRYGETADIARLCAFADTAAHRLKADVADLERVRMQAESREESRGATLRLHQSLNADSYRQETGPLNLPPSPHHGHTS